MKAVILLACSMLFFAAPARASIDIAAIPPYPQIQVTKHTYQHHAHRRVVRHHIARRHSVKHLARRGGSVTPRRHYSQITNSHIVGGRPSDCYGIPWCGCYMRHLVGVADKAYNLARNWVHFGHPAYGPAPGVIGVMSHHVFKVVSVISPGRVIAISGNDGHAVRERERSTRGVIAWRQE